MDYDNDQHEVVERVGKRRKRQVSSTKTRQRVLAVRTTVNTDAVRHQQQGIGGVVQRRGDPVVTFHQPGDQPTELSNSESVLPNLVATPIFCHGVMPYLDLEDLLSLRGISKSVYCSLHNEGVISNDLWRMILQREFGLPVLSKDETIWTVPVQQKSGVSTLAPTGMLQAVTSPFEAVMAWRKVSSVYFAGAATSSSELSSSPTKAFRVHAPYFIRGARLWQRTCHWCNQRDPDGDPANTELRLRVFGSLGKRGWKYTDWPSMVRQEPALNACRAVFAFCGGQNGMVGASDPCLSLLGSCRIYGRLSGLSLIGPLVGKPCNRVVIARDRISSRDIFVDKDTGCLFSSKTGGWLPVVHLIGDNGPNVNHENVLLWLEEYAKRLSTGETGIGKMVEKNREGDIMAITPFPRYIPRFTGPSPHLPLVSRRVTRGVEVVGSAVYAPQFWYQDGGGFKYSIRIRMLTPKDDEYVSPEVRGFHTCQLVRRRWRITDLKTGHISQVGGRGAKGMFPILWEGGFTDHRCDRNGVFECQSWTCHATRKGGLFEGYLTFVPDPPESGTWDPEIAGITDSAFRVELGAFALDARPTYLY
jgi:hypothetical protein